MATITKQAVPNTVVPVGALLTPGGDQGLTGAPGAPGPTAVSTDANNWAELGSDGLVYVTPPYTDPMWSPRTPFDDHFFAPPLDPKWSSGAATANLITSPIINVNDSFLALGGTTTGGVADSLLRGVQVRQSLPNANDFAVNLSWEGLFACDNTPGSYAYAAIRLANAANTRGVEMRFYQLYASTPQVSMSWIEPMGGAGFATSDGRFFYNTFPRYVRFRWSLTSPNTRYMYIDMSTNGKVWAYMTANINDWFNAGNNPALFQLSFLATNGARGQIQCDWVRFQNMSWSG